MQNNVPVQLLRLKKSPPRDCVHSSSVQQTKSNPRQLTLEQA